LQTSECLCSAQNLKYVQDDDLRELRDTREWLDMMATVKGGMTREQKVLLRAEARVSNTDTSPAWHTPCYYRLHLATAAAAAAAAAARHELRPQQVLGTGLGHMLSGPCVSWEGGGLVHG
jgi:hypothetical protein